ncbi:MAG: AAA family ATPase, partial [Bdellovibrionales bacterium]|nr:AAA family ATPase [Bdellovibrionales bacterium]
QLAKKTAERIASFHQEALAKPQKPQGQWQTTQKLALDNIRALKRNGRPLFSAPAQTALEYLSDYTNEFVEQGPSTIERRIEQGFYIDGHGDLRSEHVVVHNGAIEVLDCLEFNDTLRTLDALDDIAFLLMDLDYLRRSDFGATVAQEYFARLPAVFDQQLLRFYRVYRALVRAKVTLFRALQHAQHPASSAYLGPLGDVEQLLGLACRYAANAQKPALIVFAGLMGSGKSTLAAYLCTLLRAEHLQTDRLRKNLFPDHGSGRTDSYGQGLYGADRIEATYDALFAAAREQLARHSIVVLDASFAERRHRVTAQTLARELNARCIIVHCEIGREEQARRLSTRSTQETVSDGRLELADAQRHSFVPPNQDEGATLLVVEAGVSTEQQALAVLEKLSETASIG